jgi:hypothetical protein
MVAAPQLGAAMSHTEAVQRLVPIFRTMNSARPVFMLGAGCSFTSGVPVATECISRLARRVYAERVLKGAVLPFRVKPTEWQRWLSEQNWFVSEPERYAENFPLVVEHLLTPQDYRRQSLIELMQPSQIGPGYGALSELVLKGLARTILTTNFDPCLPMALDKLRPHLSGHAEVNRTRGDFAEFDLYSRAQIIWLHGRAEGYTDQNILEEVQTLDPDLKKLLTPLLTDSPIVVVGYRGAEPSITNDLFLGTALNSRGFRKGLFWCTRPGEALHPNVLELASTLGTNFIPLEISGFDELLSDLRSALDQEDFYLVRSSAAVAAGTESFDERPLHDAAIDDIDLDLALATLREYCSSLNRPIVTRDTLLPLMRELGLLMSVNSVEHPTAGCLLLFGNEPERHFPHAVVVTTIGHKRRNVVRGNLLSQRRELIDWLSSAEVNPILKVKKLSKHNEQTAYAERALVELLVNLLVHRDYECVEPATINVEPGVQIEFRNPCLLSSNLRKHVDGNGRFTATRDATDARNRSLCDVFLGVRAMEWKGTGLLDVQELTSTAGGEAAFSVSDDNNFVACVTCLPASGGTLGVARDDRPTGVYILNVLPAVALPEHISIVRVSATPNDKNAPALAEAGTYIVRGDEIWSFTPLPLLRAALSPIGVDGRHILRSEIESNPEERRILVWLLRKHFESFLQRFVPSGLALEGGRGSRRAYFVGNGAQPRALHYNSPNRRNIRREVVKQRAEAERAWFENEGFGYEVCRLDDIWGVRIKPFYMFTGPDAKTPLPSFVRTARSTRRMKFDRNKNVEDDMTFWGRFLSAGHPTINLGHAGCGDVLLDSTFLTVEVTEDSPGVT